MNHQIAIEILTEWDKQNVFPFFEKHFPNCNDARWDMSEVLIGDIWFLNDFGYLFGYEAIEPYRQNRIIAKYTILKGVPKDMQLPKVILTFDEWFDGLSEEDAIALEKKYGYHGHDIGMTTTEWRLIYEQEFTINAEVPKVEQTKTREQELEECLSNFLRLLPDYGDNNTEEWGSLIKQAKQLLNK